MVCANVMNTLNVINNSCFWLANALFVNYIIEHSSAMNQGNKGESKRKCCVCGKTGAPRTSGTKVREIWNNHRKYAHCAFRRQYCTTCWPVDAVPNGKVLALGDCIFDEMTLVKTNV
jgi:hypothetical protein